jgi:hypothetical protein
MVRENLKLLKFPKKSEAVYENRLRYFERKLYTYKGHHVARDLLVLLDQYALGLMESEIEHSEILKDQLHISVSLFDDLFFKDDN